ncbi:MAG: VOC family protein [Bacillota bacterium]
MKIRSISHSGLTVKSFEKAIKWYNEMFGFVLVAEEFFTKEKVMELFPLYGVSDSTMKCGFLRAPKGTVLEIFEFSNTAPDAKKCWGQPGFTHLTLDVRNVSKWYEKLKAKGVRFYFEPQKTGNVEWVFLQDPDGNPIELIDLKANYGVIRLLGGIAGNIMAKGKFKKYYMEGKNV